MLVFTQTAALLFLPLVQTCQSCQNSVSSGGEAARRRIAASVERRVGEAAHRRNDVRRNAASANRHVGGTPSRRNVVRRNAVRRNVGGETSRRWIVLFPKYNALSMCDCGPVEPKSFFICKNKFILIQFLSLFCIWGHVNAANLTERSGVC